MWGFLCPLFISVFLIHSLPLGYLTIDATLGLFANIVVEGICWISLAKHCEYFFGLLFSLDISWEGFPGCT